MLSGGSRHCCSALNSAIRRWIICSLADSALSPRGAVPMTPGIAQHCGSHSLLPVELRSDVVPVTPRILQESPLFASAEYEAQTSDQHQSDLRLAAMRSDDSAFQKCAVVIHSSVADGADHTSNLKSSAVESPSVPIENIRAVSKRTNWRSLPVSDAIYGPVEVGK